MRQLLPEPLDSVDPFAHHAAAHRPTPADRPWVLLNMVASLDGATAVDGVSGDLGGEADRIVFSAIRALPDVILAAAGTVRADGYGPPRTPASRRTERESRGQSGYPRIAIASRSLELDETAPLFTATPTRPIVYTVEDAPAERIRALEPVADVIRFDGEVTASGIVDHLASIGVRTVLLEGGPSLNGAFLDEDLIDELNLTIAPSLVGGTAARVVTLAHQCIRSMRLAHLWEDDGVLLGRYVRD